MSQTPSLEWGSFLDSLVVDEILSPATRNRVRSLATKMYNDALRKEMVSHNPISIIPKPKESMEAWDYWSSSDDIVSYLNEAKNHSNSFYLFACLSLNLGTRICETLALYNEDVNLSQRRLYIGKIFEEASGQVHLRTKGGKARWLGINDMLKEALVECRHNTSFRKQNEPLMCNSEGGIIRERRIRHIHDQVCERAKVKPIRIHDLRHTYASHYFMNGGSLIELQGLLGHSSPNMTLKYAHLMPGFLEKKAGVVSFGVSKENIVQLRQVK